MGFNLDIPKKKKTISIYDSHEFEMGHNTNGKRSKFSSYVIQRLEKLLMKKSVFSIMVNDSIADEVQKIHKLETRPIIVRNIPNYWEINKYSMAICGAVDVGVFTIPAVSKSYYFMLPKKLFKNIQSLAPVICSNFPEMSKIVDEYDISLLVNPEDIDKKTNAITTMRTNKAM